MSSDVTGIIVNRGNSDAVNWRGTFLDMDNGRLYIKGVLQSQSDIQDKTIFRDIIKDNLAIYLKNDNAWYSIMKPTST